MAAPAHTPRQVPNGVRLEDGFAALMAFSLEPDVPLWEKQIKPPGIDGGDPIMTTTMHNIAVHTSAPRKLVKFADPSFSCAYDPNFYHKYMKLINKRGSITVFFPDESYVDFFGYMQKFEPGELKEGEYPEAAVTIVVTNWDPVNNVESPPVWNSKSGTGT